MSSVEKDWITEAGLRAVVIASEMGHRCGYVGVPEGHVLYGKHYDDVYADVHGGLTFSSEGVDNCPVESDLHWFGFDCAHYGDAKDWPIASESYIQLCSMYSQFENEDAIIRDLPFCKRECESLAEQLS